jgi:quinol monooxygenase YgiN
MKLRLMVTLMSMTGLLALSAVQHAAAQPSPLPYVRLAELDVDPAQMDRLTAAALMHVNAAMRLEPGVLAFFAVTEKDRPARLRVFEMYADAEAYRTHLQTSHFKQFVADTAPIVTSRRLFDAVPVRIGAKPTLPAGVPLVRVAELAIAQDRLAGYKAAVTEEIDASIALEPGVLGIYAVALHDDPTQLRFFELYADESAYRQHIESPHFKKYVATTKDMIVSRQLFEMSTIVLQRRSGSR